MLTIVIFIITATIYTYKFIEKVNQIDNLKNQITELTATVAAQGNEIKNDKEMIKVAIWRGHKPKGYDVEIPPGWTEQITEINKL